MINSRFFIFAFIIFSLAGENGFAVDKKNETRESKEFNETKFLQVDEIDIPKELRRIEDQIKENAVDVIIHSKTHSPVFAQKREEGYSASYKKFHGLKIKIFPISEESDFYSLQLFYFNWTTNKFDKKLKRRISKFNVLNELRFAVYEILLGEHWIRENREKIEKENFDRIQAVRKGISENRIISKKREQEEKRKSELKEEAEERKKKNKLKREEREKKKKEMEKFSSDSDENSLEKSPKIESQNEENNENEEEILKLPKKNRGKEEKKDKKPKKQETNISDIINGENAPAANVGQNPNSENQDPPVPLKMNIYGRFNYFQEDIYTEGLLNITTRLKYVGIGGIFYIEQLKENPGGMRFLAQFGIPIFKEKYSFPVNGSIESEYYKYLFVKNLKMYGGIDISQIFFVGLSDLGAGLEVIQNRFFWGKVGLSLTSFFKEREFLLRGSFSKSLGSTSSENIALSAIKYNYSVVGQIDHKQSIEVLYQKIVASGKMNLNSQLISLAYIYKLEN